MTTALRLQSIPLPWQPKADVRRCLTDPRRQFLGLLTDEGLQVLSYQNGLGNPTLFKVPSTQRGVREETVQMAFMGKLLSMSVPRVTDPPPIAIHPHGDRIAFVTDEAVRLLGPAGQESLYPFEAAPTAHVKDAVFSSSGEALWVSREYSHDTARQSLPDPWDELLAFSTTDGRLLGSLPARGELQGGHNLAAHPTLEVVGLEVSCGQDGSWITFASLQQGRVTPQPERIDRDNDPFHFAGFAPDGRGLITVGDSTVEEFQWPGCQVIANVQADPDDEGEGYFGWNGAYVGPYFFALAEGEEEDVLYAYICPGLRPVVGVEVKPSSKQLNGRVYGLGDDLLITDGAAGIRAWRVTPQ